MSKVLVGTFQERDRAQQAIDELKAEGFENEISLIVKDEQGNEDSMSEASMEEGQSLAGGAVTGGVLGGLAGLLAGTGALLIPGIGPVLAAGPFAATLTGIVGGGLAGGLVDYGIPEERSQYYEEKVRQGSVLITMEASEGFVQEAATVLRSHGAEDVETHG